MKDVIVTCNHCKATVPIHKAHKTEWKEIELTWYHCEKCEEGVFGNKKEV